MTQHDHPTLWHWHLANITQHPHIHFLCRHLTHSGQHPWTWMNMLSNTTIKAHTNANAYHHGSSYTHNLHRDQRKPLWLWELAGTLSLLPLPPSLEPTSLQLRRLVVVTVKQTKTPTKTTRGTNMPASSLLSGCALQIIIAVCYN